MVVADPAPVGSLDDLVHVEESPFALQIGPVRIGGRETNLFNAWDTYNTGICRTREGGRPIAAECFSLGSQEAVYGFGERFTTLDKVGQTVDLVMVEGTGTTTPRAYKNVPLWVSTAGYGVFLHTTARATAWVGSLQSAAIQVGVEEDVLDYYVLLGDIPTVLHRYTGLTGRAPAPPPAWSFGWWQSKISYTSAEETLAIARRMRAAELPLDVIHLDTHWFREDWQCDLEFDPQRFPDPEAYLAELRDLGVRVSLWQLPYVPEGSSYYDELLAVDGFVKTREGDVYDTGLCWTPGYRGTVGAIDFTNPRAVQVYQGRLRRLLEMGAAAIKVDFGEQAPIDGVYSDGTPGHLAHNLYPLLYNRAVAEVTEEVTGERIMWARSAWAGSQRYPLHWGGDSSTNWENLAPQFAGGLSFGLSGFQFWAQDIGGFLGSIEQDPDLLVRWVQAGVLVSHARIHGAGTRELDMLPADVRERCAEAVRLRYRLLPYLLATAQDCVDRSLPMARALVVHHQDDPTTWPIGDQWYLGDALLVAPVFSPTGTRKAYLPAGRWIDWHSGEAVEGGRWLDLDVPLDRIPLWQRAGTVVALGPDRQHTADGPTDPLVLRVADGPGEHHLRLPLERGEVAVHLLDGDLRWTGDVPGEVVVERR
jgi:alpha-D-xyloside xylohydrolase